MDPTQTSVATPVVATEAAPAPVAQSPAVQPTQSAPSSPAVSQQSQADSQRLILESLKSRGLDVSSFDNDDSFLGEIEGFTRSMDQNRKLANYGRKYLTHAEQFEKFIAEQGKSQSPVQQQPTQPKQVDDPWAPLEYDEAWTNYAVFDPNKRAYVPKDEWANPVAAEKLNSHQRLQAERLRKLASDPIGSIQSKIEEIATRKAQEIFEQRMQATQNQNAADQFIQQNYNEWVVLDQNGNPRFDPNTGMELMTPKGVRALELAQEAVSLGIGTAQGRQQYVDRFLRYEFPAQQSAPARQQQAPEQTAADKRESFLQRVEGIQTGQHRPSTSTAVAEPSVMTGPGKPGSSDFIRIAKVNAEKMGVQL